MTSSRSDIVEHQDGATSGIDGLRALITELRTAFPDLHLAIEATATSGDTTWFRIHSTGTNDGPLFGRPPTGRPIDITVIDIMRVEDGLHGRALGRRRPAGDAEADRRDGWRSPSLVLDVVEDRRLDEGPARKAAATGVQRE